MDDYIFISRCTHARRRCDGTAARAKNGGSEGLYPKHLKQTSSLMASPNNVVSIPNRQRRRRRKYTEINSRGTSRRNRSSSSSAVTILLASLAFSGTNMALVSATKNFCGSNWGDASADCDNRQPCPSGTDEECTYGGQCWGDTNCDTSLGHGILFDLEHPTHQRFCGKNWEDANKNCSLKRHCPSGESDECPGEEECYSFLSGCNYVDMIGGPLQGGGSGGDGSGGSGKIPSNDPSRSNFCGRDWNDAIMNCNDDSHWCPSGSDGDCPPGKSCFGGTECKYIADLVPTETPTEGPTEVPTPSPIMYNTAENTSFCGSGWEDASKHCRIGSHCPSGSDNDCPGSQVCFTWLSGCNVVDFNEHLADTGTEIFGPQHYILTEDMFPEDKTKGEPQLPPAEMMASMPSQNGNNNNNLQQQPQQPQQQPAMPPQWQHGNVLDPSNNNVQQQPQQQPALPPQWQHGNLLDPSNQNENLATNPPAMQPITDTPTTYDPDRFIASNHIFCGTTWNDANDRCSPETFCSDGAAFHKCEQPNEFCWVGIKACDAGQWKPTWEPTHEPTRFVTGSPTRRPTSLPTRDPTPLPTINSVVNSEQSSSSSSQTTTSAAESQNNTPVETTVVRQSYCAEDYQQLMSSCATLDTCNRYKPCKGGYSCFSNVKCVVPVQQQTPQVETDVQTSVPITLAPITNSPVATTPIPTYQPTYNPTQFTLSDEEIAQRLTNMNNYCASSLAEVEASCSFSLHTCNPGDGMCPIGTYCFENVICPDKEVASSAVQVILPVTPLPTKLPTPFPTRMPTVRPVVLATTSEVGNNKNQNDQNNNSKYTAQNYCAQSLEMVLLTCSTAPTCNDGDGGCPSGYFCFPNTVCSSGSSSNFDSINNGRVTPGPTAPRPITNAPVTTPEPVLPSPLEVTSSEATGKSPTVMKPASTSNGGNMKQNYCAQSAQQLAATCIWAPTCNSGDEPCPPNTTCFSNVMCTGRPSNDGTEAEAAGYLTTLNPTVKPTIQYDDTMSETAIIDLECEGLCLQPIDHTDCEYVQSIDNIMILPCSGNEFIQVEVGDLCLATGQCGTDLELNNCADKDIYVLVDPVICIESGFLSGSGVLPAPGSNGIGEDMMNELVLDNDGFQPDDSDIETEVNDSATEAAPDPDTAENPEYGTFAGNSNQDDILTGWWRMENESSGSYVGSMYCSSIIFSSLGFILMNSMS